MRTFLATFFCLAMMQGAAQAADSIALKHGAHRAGRRTDVHMQRWREHALGQFIHWGVYAIPGGQWNGKYYPGAAEWIRSWSEMPKKDYDNLYKQFNPTDFDAQRWARQAKDMGVKYMIFTTKHHDGFCLWPSRYTSYTVASTPYRKDVVRQIVDAYSAEGIDVHLYFSIIDWNHKGYRSAPPQTPKEVVAYEEFKTFTANQLVELLTNYPTIKGLWFDGSWDKAWVEQAAWVDSLGMKLRAMSSGLIIGSRFRADEYGKRHYDSNGNLIDDYDQTWERDIPENISVLRGNDWDCVMTIPENQWGYHSDWRGYVKTSADLIEMLVRCVAMDGNFVVNFGPDGRGNIRPEEAAIAREVGEWMRDNGQALYGAAHADLKQQGWGYFTQKEGKIYATVFNRPVNNLLSVEFPRGASLPVEAYFLVDGKPVEIINAGRNKRNGRLYKFAIPPGYTASKPFVIVIEMQQNVPSGEDYHQAKT
ncbi:MAG: alpha-L-fucosidase [Prevotellaceae bacterium]|nr:alpha-L-fucosidase [Prevotellaceae bacterium]